MDDKRLLIAFLLVGLIFVLMPYYYEWMGIQAPAPQPEATREAERDTLSGTVAGPDSLATPQPTRSPTAARSTAAPRPVMPATAPGSALGPDIGSLDAPAVASPARFVDVVTPLQRLRFSTAGGNLVSVELRQYEQAQGGRVELVPKGGSGLGLTLKAEAGSDTGIDLSQVHFEPDHDSLRVEGDGVARLRLRADLGDGRSVEKEVVVHGDEYGIQVAIRLTGFGPGTLVFAHWSGGIALAERDPELDVKLMKAMAFLNESLLELEVDEDESDSKSERGVLRWAGVRNKYFLAALAPLEESHQRVELSGHGLSEAPFRFYDVAVGTLWDDVEDGRWEMLLYAGPLDLAQVARYDRDFYRAMNLGFPVVRDIAKVLLKLFVMAHRFVPNYGWVIVLFGVTVKIIVYPLTHKSYESTAKMQELQPKLQALREKYKNNNQKLSQETMKLYREEGVNPLGGCLPMVFQMPIFLALYQVFRSAIQLRQSPWILWVDDLSLPDTVALAGFQVHVLPLLMATAMFFQSKMTMKDPKQAALVYVMPVVMVFIMWRFSSGLVLYWTVFNVLQIGQQVLTNHLKLKKEAAAAAPGRR